MPSTAIDPSQPIPAIVEQYPASREIFLAHGIDPTGYVALQHESLRATCLVHQLDVDTLLKQLGQVIH